MSDETEDDRGDSQSDGREDRRDAEKPDDGQHQRGDTEPVPGRGSLRRITTVRRRQRVATGGCGGPRWGGGGGRGGGARFAMFPGSFRVCPEYPKIRS